MRKKLRLLHVWMASISPRPNNVLVDLESDCANLVTKVNNNSRDQSVISAIICDIKEGMTTRGACLLRKIWREQNRTAHNLAQFALKSRSSQISYSFVHYVVSKT
jgi:hypothetical protein